MHRITLGNFELTAISDGIYHSDGGAFFGVVPKSLWAKRVQPDENNVIAVGLNSIVVRTGEKTVLIETGIGNKMPERMVKIYGQPAKLLDNLSAAGFAPEDIDIVINSHLHFDHCGWNTVLRGATVVPTFPRAKYYVQEGEVQHGHLQLERDAISYISANYDPLVESGQMTLLKGDHEIVPGISVKVFPGHTRDMQAIILYSGGKTACYISDLIPTSAHLDLTWSISSRDDQKPQTVL
jgi:glyoxylase-like metal-dependent hydrolase (beta-lactamase superfamily II)